MKIKTELNKLKSEDVYSLLMFAMFKMNNVKELASISELAYTLDRKNLLRLCEYFGGLTIRIPTISELETLVYTLILYQLVDIDKCDFEEALKYIKNSCSDVKRVKNNYEEMREVLSNYDFSKRE